MVARLETKHRLDPVLEHKLILKLNRLQEDYAWILHEKKLSAEHLNKYVAVKNKTVKFDDTDFRNLLEQIKTSKKNVDDYAIDLIRKRPVCLLL